MVVRSTATSRPRARSWRHRPHCWRCSPDFFGWQPIPPRNAKQLAADQPRASAACCATRWSSRWRENSPALDGAGWRTGASCCSPMPSDAQFADGYAQAVTFGLLVARARDIDPRRRARRTPRKELRKIELADRHGAAAADRRSAISRMPCKTSLGTLTRVLDVVDWHDHQQGQRGGVALLLRGFPRGLRQRAAQEDRLLLHAAGGGGGDGAAGRRGAARPELFDRREGLAAPTVTICRSRGRHRHLPAGRAPAHRRRRSRPTRAKARCAAAIAAAAERIIGFELQFGPFAVAQLRLIAEMQSADRQRQPQDRSLAECSTSPTRSAIRYVERGRSSPRWSRADGESRKRGQRDQDVRCPSRS